MVKKNIWVVVPAFNEGKYLKTFLLKLKRFNPQFIVVDDGSRDNTISIAQKYAQYALRHRVNLGKGAALRTGCDFAFSDLQADAVVVMDGDDQHDPADLSLFTRALEAGSDVVFGIREESEGMPWLKLKLNRLSSFITSILFGAYILDIPSGYKAFTKKAYPQIQWQATNYAVELEITARTIKQRLPYTTVCIKTIYHDMNKGFSILNLFDMVLYLLKLKLAL